MLMIVAFIKSNVILYKRFKTIDAACIPSGMQGPYPAFYENLDINQKTIESNIKKIKNFDVALNYLNIKAKKIFSIY